MMTLTQLFQRATHRTTPALRPRCASPAPTFAADALHRGRYGESDIPVGATVEQAAALLAGDVLQDRVPENYACVALSRLFPTLSKTDIDTHLRRGRDLARIADDFDRLAPMADLLGQLRATDFPTFSAAAFAHDHGLLTGGKWITVGAQDGNDGKRHGGTPVFLSESGHVTKGPAALTGSHVSDLRDDPAFDRGTGRPVGHTGPIAPDAERTPESIAQAVERGEDVRDDHLLEAHPHLRGAAMVKRHEREAAQAQKEAAAEVPPPPSKLEQLKAKISSVATRKKSKAEPAALPRAELRRRILEHHQQSGGAVDDDVHRFADNLQSAFVFRRGGPYSGEVNAMLREGGKDGVAMARSGAVRFVGPNESSGGEDALTAFRERYGAHGEDVYWRLARERAGLGWKDALEHAHRSEDPQIRFLAALHDATPTRKAERATQDSVPASSLPMDAEFEIHGEPVRVTEDEDGQRVLQDGATLPETPLEALDDVPVDKGSLRERELPEIDLDADPFHDLGREFAATSPRLNLDQLKSRARGSFARRARSTPH